MKCIAIDDEPLALKLLEHYCSQVPTIQLLGTYSDPVEAVSYIRTLHPDLIFLDIRMPDISGMNIAQGLGKETLVIFTTAHKEYAVEGFELDVVDYLLKPFGFERFLKAYNKAEQRFHLMEQQHSTSQHILDNKTIIFKHNYQNIQLAIHTILYIQACNNYIMIVTPSKSYMTAITMKAARDLLTETEFIRIHKSFIVAVNKINTFNNEHVIIEGKQIPVGRSYRKGFLEKMKTLKRGE